MIQGNIFGKKPEVKATRIVYETTEFDFTDHLIESSIQFEDLYYSITHEHLIATHASLKEGNMEILQEGLGNFGKSASTFFKNMAEKFKELMNKIFMYFRAYMGNFEKFLKKYSNELMKLEPDFTIEGYEYSFNDSLPKLDRIQSIISEYNSEIKEIGKMSKEDLIKKRDDFSAMDNLDDIRGYVIGANSSIHSEDYIEEVKKSYRSGMEKKENIVVDATRLKTAVGEYSEIKKVLGECIKEKDKTIMILQSLETFFSRSASVHYKGDKKVMYAHTIQKNDRNNGIKTDEKQDIDYNSTNLDTVNLFYSMKLTESKEFGSIATTAIVEKTNALKEALKLNEMIIKRSLGSKKPKGEVSE